MKPDLKPIVLNMSDLPRVIEVIGPKGNKKTYHLVPAGVHGACLNKAPDAK